MIYESWSKRRSYAKRWSRWSRIKIFLLWRIHLERTITSELTSFNRITVHRSHPFGSNWIDDKNSNPFGMIWRRMLLENYQSGSEWSFRFLFWLIKYHLTFSRCRGCVIWCWRMIGHFLCIFFSNHETSPFESVLKCCSNLLYSNCYKAQFLAAFE